MNTDDTQKARTQQNVYNDLEAGTRVRWEDWFPGRGRREKEGEILRVKKNLHNYVFTQYHVETENGWSLVSARQITAVIG